MHASAAGHTEHRVSSKCLMGGYGVEARRGPKNTKIRFQLSVVFISTLVDFKLPDDIVDETICSRSNWMIMHLLHYGRQIL